MAKHRTWIELDERAFRNNVASLRAVVGKGTRICAVLKANAYGHGLPEIGRMAVENRLDAFAVDSVDEAASLRAVSPDSMILIIGYTLHERLPDALEIGAALTVYDAETVRLLDTHAGKMGVVAEAHLKIDTGMSRQGILPDGLEDMLSVFASCQNVRLAGLSTHFANVDDVRDLEYTARQCAAFESCVETVRAASHEPEWVHCAKSAACLLYPDTHANMVRPGIALYGIWPSAEVELAARTNGTKCDLMPVLTWKTRVAQIKSVPSGTPVGYGLTEVLRRKSRIAVLPVGYYDGYDRKLSNAGDALIGGTRCRVLGRVCMNMIMVDVSDVPSVEPEQEAILLGRAGRHAVTAEHLAAKVGTTPYEIVTRLNPALPRLRVAANYA
jgi:alanine racemase